MGTSDANFPRWSAPFVGMLVGTGIGLKSGQRTGEGLSPTWLIGGAIIGGLAGGLIFLLDSPPAATDDDSLIQAPQQKVAPTDSGTLISRFFALLSLPLFWVPVVNLILAGVSLLLNRKTQGWPKTVTKIALALSVLITLLLIGIASTK